MSDLAQLVTQAKILGGTPCHHDWRHVGGRQCKCDPTGYFRSQSVFQCARCETYDYGQPGGPGHEDCKQNCEARGMEEMKT